MASATFTLRAVDATRAAFASVQNSLTRLENQTKGIAKITKLAKCYTGFGGSNSIHQSVSLRLAPI